MSNRENLIGPRQRGWLVNPTEPLRTCFRLACLIAFLATAGPSRATAGTIDTPIGGSSGDGYSCDVVRFIPQQITFDFDGRLVVADTWDHRIRRIDGNDISSTVVGIGGYGFNGDNILGVQAKLASPVGVAVGSDGDIYVADQANQRVRRVDKITGIITTVAGTGATTFNGDGPGVSSNLNYPSRLSYSSAGLLIADSANHRIRLLDSQGYLRTVAGSGTMGWTGDGGAATSARLTNPTHAITDGSGNIYIADKSNCRVRRVTANGIITTFAGMADPAVSLPCGRAGDNGPANAAKLSAPAGLALDPQEQYLYILDTTSAVVRRVNLASGIITHVAGTGFSGSAGDGGPATQAQLSLPSGISVNAAGEVFIADSDLRTIRKIDANGIIHTIAGGGSGDGLPAEVARISPKGLALDPWGNIHLTDASGNQSRLINTQNQAEPFAGTGSFGYAGDGGLAAQAALAYPVGIAVDSTGRMCFSDQLNQRVRCVSPGSEVITTVAGTGQAMWNGDGTATAASLNYPAGLAVDTDNSILVADSANYRIRRIKNGSISTVAGTGAFVFNGDGLGPLETNLNTPTGVVIDADHNLYIAEKSSCRIRKYNAASGVMSIVAGTGTCGSTNDGGQATLAKINGPENLAIHPDGILYFSESFAPKVRQIDLATGVISRVAGTGIVGFSGDGGNATLAQMMRPSGLLLDQTATHLYIGDFDAGNVRRVTLDLGGGASQPSWTPTPTGTPTLVPTLPFTPTAVPPAATFTRTATFTSTRTETPDDTSTPTTTATKTETVTRTPTITATFTRTASATRTPILISTPTNTLAPSATPTPQPNTPTPDDTNTPLPASTAVDTPQATATRTETAEPAATFTRTATAVSTATRTPTQALVATLTRTPTNPLAATATRTQTKVPTSTATRTQTKVPTSTATRTRTRTRTPTKPAASTATRTATRTSTHAATSTRTRTPTLTRTATRTATGGAATSTATPAALVTTPTAAVGTATRTRTLGSTATRTRTATLTRTPTKVATSTRTRTGTITRTPTRTKTPTRTFTGAPITIVPTATWTPVPTDTPTLTPTPTVDPLRSEANVGPRVTHLGLATSGGTVLQRAGVENGIDVYTRTSGYGFYLILEVEKGSAGNTIGRFTARSGTSMADLQMEVSRDIGNGSPAWCDTASGGSQAINPLDFEPSSFVINATSDFTCGFTSTNSPSLAVTYAAGGIRSFADPATMVQFSYLLPSWRSFALGDTLVTGRVLDTSGNPGPIEQIILRIG